MGGAFGGKESQGNLPALLAALAAHRTGRPAKTVYDRDDDFMLTGKRHDFRIDYDVGFDAEGRIQAVLFEQALRCGMSWICPRRLRRAPCAMPTMPTTFRICG